MNSESLNSEKIEITRFNLNDQTVAAISVINKPFFGVQYHPEASPGPMDSFYLFERFAADIDEKKTMAL